MVLFGFFALVLVSVYWVNRAVILFDRLVSDGHSAGIVLEFTALSLPAVIALVLPMAGFAAAVYVTNRLSGDSELTVVKATGFSPWRLARPVLAFGVILALILSILTHVLVPKSIEQLRLREQEIAGSISARLLREGAFLHPTEGVTFYIRAITAEGELQDVFLADARQGRRETTYTAERAYLLRDDEGPKLVMLSGMAQSLNRETGSLATTNFADLTYDISGLITTGPAKRRRIQYIGTHELLSRLSQIAEETNEKPGEVLEEAHMRFQLPLLALIAPLIGFSALVAGGFSRFGVTKQIVMAIFLLVLVKLVESAVTGAVHETAMLWPMIYLPSLFGATMAALLLWHAGRNGRPARRNLPETGATA